MKGAYMDRTINKQAAIYLRLSKDDRGDESASIANQRSLIRSFCEEKDIRIIAEFQDDGRSGGNFNRPGFEELIAFTQSHPVDLVITKDLSRLGRDMSESSMYAERYFTERGIRYLAISDNFDSFEDNLLAPFQFAMNDVYIRDASRKVKAVLSNKRESGQYCACPPFGYKKSTQNKNKLVPDEMTAPIVKLIFEYAADGYSTNMIAQKLTAANCITPLKYRVLYRDEFSDRGASRATDIWVDTTVKRIIQNRVYVGDTVLGKTRKISPKSKTKVKVPKDEWCVTEGTHEGLVTKERFELANEKIKQRTTRYRQREMDGLRVSVFRGKVFCECCGSAMCSGGSTNLKNDTRKPYWYLICLNACSRAKKKCVSPGRIKYHHLVDIITQELNSFIDLSDEQINSIIESLKSDDYAERHNARIKQQCSVLEKEIADINSIVEKMYRDNISGRLSDERLDAMILSMDEKEQTAKKTLEDLKSQIINNSSETERYEKFFSIVKAYTHIEELTPEILDAFVDRIEIGEPSIKRARKRPVEQTIKIYYKFIGNTGDQQFTH